MTLNLSVPMPIDIALDLHLMGKAAMHGIVAQQMGIGLDRAQIVDRHHIDILAARFEDGADDIAPDPAEAVDRHTHFHDCLRCNRLFSGRTYSRSALMRKGQEG